MTSSTEKITGSFPAIESDKQASFNFTDSRGKWTLHEKSSTHTTEVTWIIEIQEGTDEPGRESAFTNIRRLNRVTSFSHSLHACVEEQVLLIEHAACLPEEDVLAVQGLRHILRQYKNAGGIVMLSTRTNAHVIACLKQIAQSYTLPVIRGAVEQTSEGKLPLKRPSSEHKVPPKRTSSKDKVSPQRLPSDSEDQDDSNYDDPEATDDEEFDSDEESEYASAPTERGFTTPRTTTPSTPISDIHMPKDLLKQLTQIVTNNGRRPNQNRNLAQAQRAVTRTGKQPGLGQRLGTFFQGVISQSNTAYDLDAVFPVKLSHILPYMDEGLGFVQAFQANKASQALAGAAVTVANTAGRACRSSVVGLISKSVDGAVPSRDLAHLMGCSVRYVNSAKKKVTEGDQGEFSGLHRSASKHVQTLCPTRMDPQLGACKEGDSCKYLHECQSCNNGNLCAAFECTDFQAEAAKANDRRRILKARTSTRNHVTDAELHGTKTHMAVLCPARSGDKQRIFWKNKSRDELYYEDICSVQGQTAIITAALEEFGERLREEAATGTTVFLRNVRTYLTAVKDDAVADLQVCVAPREDSPVSEVLEEVLAEAARQEGVVVDEVQVDEPSTEDDEDESVHSTTDGERILYPRSYRFVFGKLLHGERLWDRPPHDHCERCAQFEKCICRIRELTPALLSNVDDPEHAQHAAVLERAGGQVKADEELRKNLNQRPDLQKHVQWFQEVRAYDKKRQECMEDDTLTLQLDYGGFTDSAGKKVSVWSVTALSASRKQVHFDFFFDQADKKMKGAGKSKKDGKAKKDGQTGIYFLRELLDPNRSPMGNGVSMLQGAFPEVKHLIFSGDTGNGFRAYAMLDELSCVYEKYGYTVELSPLAPGHAWNRTDARIAHMNTFLRLLKARSRVFGAKGVAAAFHAASDQSLKNRRQYMERSYIFFREVEVDQDQAAETRKSLGNMIVSDTFHNGKMGVKGLLYFNFAVKDVAGNMVHPPGHALVMEHPDPEHPNNPTYVYTWRKELSKDMCQPCSDRHGGPVSLSVSKCTKKKCSVLTAEAQARQAAEESSLLASMPLFRSPQRDDETQPQFCSALSLSSAEDSARLESREEKMEQFSEAKWISKSKDVVRELRVVHGQRADQDRPEIWMYVPFVYKNPGKHKNQSNQKRKGYWLHPSPGKPGHYYIGPAEQVQSHQSSHVVPDVTVFMEFPFLETWLENAKGVVKRNSLLLTTNRPLSEDELVLARGGEEIHEQASVYSDENQQKPKRKAKKRLDTLEEEEEEEEQELEEEGQSDVQEEEEIDDDVDQEEEEGEEAGTAARQCVPTLSAYEAQRQERIQQNQALLRTFGLAKGVKGNCLLDTPVISPQVNSSRHSPSDEDEEYVDKSEKKGRSRKQGQGSVQVRRSVRGHAAPPPPPPPPPPTPPPPLPVEEDDEVVRSDEQQGSGSPHASEDYTSQTVLNKVPGDRKRARPLLEEEDGASQLRIDYIQLTGDISKVSFFAHFSYMPMKNLFFILKEIKESGLRRMAGLGVSPKRFRSNVTLRMYWLMQVSDHFKIKARKDQYNSPTRQAALFPPQARRPPPTKETSSSTCPPMSYKLVPSVINMQGHEFHIDGTCIAYFGQQLTIAKVVVDIVDKSDINTLLALVIVTKVLVEAAQQRFDEDEREAVLQSSVENMSMQFAAMEEDDAVQVRPKRARLATEPFANTALRHVSAHQARFEKAQLRNLRRAYIQLTADIWIAEHFAKTNMPMDNLCLVLQDIKDAAHKVCDKLFVRAAEVRDSMIQRGCFLKQVSQLATIRTSLGEITEAPAEESSSSTRWPNVDRVINMQGRVFYIDFTRTSAYSHYDTVRHLGSVAASLAENSDNNTLLALVAVTKALGEAAQQRLLDDEDKREAVPEQSRMLLIPTTEFRFHPAYYVQPQGQAILDEHKRDFDEANEDEDVAEAGAAVSD